MHRLLFLLFISICIHSYSCECRNEYSEFSPIYLSRYDRIFTCKIISSDSFEVNRNYKVAVLKTYWGAKQDTAIIETSIWEGACGIFLEKDSIYLIYGNSLNKVRVSLCSPSRPLTQNIDKEFEGYGDSIVTIINGQRKNYSTDYLKTYTRETSLLELKYLDTLSQIINGNLIFHFSNGQISGELEIKSNKLNGMSSFYLPNGKLLSKGNFSDNIKEGIWHEHTYKSIRGVEKFHILQKGLYVKNEKRGKWKGKMITGTLKKLRKITDMGDYTLDHDYK